MKATKTIHEGYLMVDHRASPGIPADQALRMGINPKNVGEGKVFEAATMRCNHCGTNFIRNPKRIRQRGWCSVCDHYVCDLCEGIRHQTGYVHYTIGQLANLVMSGKYEVRGSFSQPQVIPRQGV